MTFLQFLALLKKRGGCVSSFPAVSFQQISQILELTDQLDISREAVEIPLSPESPGVVHRLANGKIEIVVDADLPFDEWLPTVTPKVQALMTEAPSSQ
jgi:hypothetical protein